MGSPPNESGRRDDEAKHEVVITDAFLMGKNEVTQKQFAQVMGFNPSHFSKDGNGKAKIQGMDVDQFPVEQVTWFDAIEFCNRLSQRKGYTPCYKISGKQMEGPSIVKAKIELDTNANGYRLPTEAEWEYACRAGTTTRFHFAQSNNGKFANHKPGYSTGGYGIKVARFKDLGRPTTVGSYPANAWELQEMHGNVAEWCWDWYGKDYYPKSPKEAPTGPDDGDHRVLRGGSWLVSEESCRSASRFWQAPGAKSYFSGFRVVRKP